MVTRRFSAEDVLRHIQDGETFFEGSDDSLGMSDSSSDDELPAIAPDAGSSAPDVLSFQYDDHCSVIMSNTENSDQEVSMEGDHTQVTASDRDYSEHAPPVEDEMTQHRGTARERGQCSQQGGNLQGSQIDDIENSDTLVTAHTRDRGRGQGRGRGRGRRQQSVRTDDSPMEDDENSDAQVTRPTRDRSRGQGRGRGRRRRQQIDYAEMEDDDNSDTQVTRHTTRDRSRGRGRGRGRGHRQQSMQTEMEDDDNSDTPVTAHTRDRGRGQGRGRGRGRRQQSTHTQSRGRGQTRGRGRRQSVNRGSNNTESEWLTTPTPVTVESFTGTPGPTQPLPHDPAELFKLFFTDEVLEIIVRETNRYAELCRKDNLWQTSKQEITAYFGFQVLMGLVKEPEIRDYWSKDPRLRYESISSRISRDRFEEITRFLHFVDNSVLPNRGQAGFNRLQKIQPIIDAIRKQCLQVYEPKQENSIDEAMIPFKGRSTMKQYLPKKPIKRGFKVWVRAESSTGFFSDFEVYTGKSSGQPEEADEDEETLGLGERVVLNLANSLQQYHYKLFYDNYFSTCRLAEKLLEKGIYSCGTARTDRRGFPEELKGLRLSRGEFEFRQKGGVVATVWKDKREVTMISTLTSGNDTTTVERRQKDGSKVNVPCPQAVATYNKYMSGVDKGDQLRQYYKVRMKSNKCYKYVFWFLFDVSVTNSFILSHYTASTNIYTALKNFRLDLASALIGDYNSRKRAGRPRALTHHSPLLSSPQSGPSPAQSPCSQLHLPTRSYSKRCSHCHSQGHRRDTIWICSECPGQPALCLTGKGDDSDCFRVWHYTLTQ